jgi:hypothetical protein
MNKQYRELVERLAELNISSFHQLDHINSFLMSIDSDEKEILIKFDSNTSIKDKILFIVYSDLNYLILKKYLKTLNYNYIAKEKNCSRQNIYNMVQNKIKKLQIIVDNSHEKFDVKTFLLNKK